MNSKRNFWIAIILLVVVGIFIYLVSFGEINVISDAEHAEALKRKAAEERLKELEAEMKRNLALKERLDRYVFWGFLGAKVVVLAAIFCTCLLVKFVFHVSWNDLYDWQSKAVYCIGACLLIFFGTEIKCIRAYPWLKAMVKTWVYRKYGHLNLEQKIEGDSEEMKQLKGVIESLTNIQFFRGGHHLINNILGNNIHS